MYIFTNIFLRRMLKIFMFVAFFCSINHVAIAGYNSPGGSSRLSRENEVLKKQIRKVNKINKKIIKGNAATSASTAVKGAAGSGVRRQTNPTRIRPNKKLSKTGMRANTGMRRNARSLSRRLMDRAGSIGASIVSRVKSATRAIGSGVANFNRRTNAGRTVSTGIDSRAFEKKVDVFENVR